MLSLLTGFLRRCGSALFAPFRFFWRVLTWPWRWLDSPQARRARLEAGRQRRLDDHGYPRATEDQNYFVVKAFVESVNEKAVCALAARLNQGIPCRVVKRARGSFNYCLFLEFDRRKTPQTVRWVVRLPISHTVDRPWDKVVSEVTTIRYIQEHTTIPVPRLHAFGREVSLVRRRDVSKTDAKLKRADRSRQDEDEDQDQDQDQGQVYIITDYVAGTTLDTRLLTTVDPALRQSFYLQLVDILTELRKLEFPRIGSLVPSPRTDIDDLLGDQPVKAVLGPTLSMLDNILCLPSPPMWKKTAQYMDHQFDVLYDLFAEPAGSFDKETKREELVGLEGLRQLFRGVARMGPRGSGGPFILNHCDLRSPNIIVDDQLRIQAIIDWEFTGSVPLALFTPPSWITGYHNHSEETKPLIHFEFRQALHARAQEDKTSRKMEIEWYGKGAAAAPDAPLSPNTLKRFCIARILQKPPEAVDLFYEFLAGDQVGDSLSPRTRTTDEDKEELIAKYFEDHPTVVAMVEDEVQRRYEQSKTYRKYLDDNGIYERLEDRDRSNKSSIRKRLAKKIKLKKEDKKKDK